jgi:hypothetical protein
LSPAILDFRHFFGEPDYEVGNETAWRSMLSLAVMDKVKARIALWARYPIPGLRELVMTEFLAKLTFVFLTRCGFHDWISDLVRVELSRTLIAARGRFPQHQKPIFTRRQLS